LQASVNGGTKVDEKEFIISTELLMVQLLKLDSIEAEGEAKTQRKNEVSWLRGNVCIVLIFTFALIAYNLIPYLKWSVFSAKAANASFKEFSLVKAALPVHELATNSLADTLSQ